jgi:hypothetical protein
MVDKIIEPKISKKKNRVSEIEHLIKQAEKLKSGYEYQDALNVYENALIALELQVGKNGRDEKKVLRLRYRIYDGRADCYNWMAQTTLELE